MLDKTKSLDINDYSLHSYEPIKINLPAIPEMTKDDVDAQLFAFVAMSAKKGSGITGIGDLDDTWVQEHFPSLRSMDELRGSIERDLIKNAKSNQVNLKLQLCNDELVKRLEGDIPQSILDSVLQDSRELYENQLREGGSSKTQYLREEKITEEEYEERLMLDVKYRISLDIVLDKMVEHFEVKVGEDELTQYLSSNDPDAFLKEIRATNRVEEACIAAARVKIMRDVIDNAVVTLV